MHENILLINPALNPASQNKVINAVINKTFPTSLGVLAGFLMSVGLSAPRIIDEQIDFIPNRKLKDLIFSLVAPKIIGLSVLTINSKRAYELSKSIKEIDPQVLVVLGGIHPTVLPEEALYQPGVDVVVRGEGEETIEELARLVVNGDDYRRIQGISFKENGKIIHNSDRPFINELDRIPPFPYHLFAENKDRYSSFGSIITSRGCPHSCIFCSSRSISGKKYRYFSVERVISEIKLLTGRYQEEIVWFMDDNLAADQGRFKELLDAIIASGLHKKASFHCSMRADNINAQLLDWAKEANFKMIAFGLETGSEELMKTINKQETVKEVADAIRLTDKKNIAVATTVIFGLPDETRKDRWDTLRLVRSLPLSSVRFNTLTPYPGTPVYDRLMQRGRITIKDHWENFAVQYMWEGDELPYVPDNNNCYELMFDTMFANMSYYLSISGLKRMMKSSFAGGNVIALQKRWYLSPRTIFRLLRVLFYLIGRFLFVSSKMLLVDKGSR